MSFPHFPITPYKLMRPLGFRIVVVLGFFLTGCGGPLVGVTVVDERTALENQVLGTYQELNQQVMLVASVRYIDSISKSCWWHPFAISIQRAN